MPETPPTSDETVASGRRIRWDALAAIIAALIGLLALLVSGYTAYIERQQVRAQVWPYLISGNDDMAHALIVDNKGMGPAIVRSVQVRVDDKPQTNWNHVLVALGLHLPPHQFVQTTVNHYVLSPGEHLQMIRFADKELWQRFHNGALNRLAVDICFCSTLAECWISSNGNIIGPPSMSLQLRMRPVDRCPRLPAAEVFNN